MRTSSFLRVVAFIFISTLLLTSCKPTSTSTPGASETTQPQETVAVPENASQTENIPSTASAVPETTNSSPDSSQPTPTPIVETRLPPERWQEWPVVPELTGREVSIYNLGLSLGNDSTHFSKVGDCQAIKEVLMGIYDLPDRYNLTENEAYLQETIDHFSGSFNRDGQGVRGGFNAAAVLSPIWADPEACQPGETPIACEYRIHRPSFVIISLEVWWEGRTVERYKDYMRQILDFYIERGVVPILSTKADNVEGDHRINLATAELAYEYHLPLWNFWLAVQPMPNHGIDPDRDGFHISYEAWSVRSFTALQALDAVWRSVQADQPPEEAVTPQESPTPRISFAEINFTPMPIETTAAIENPQLVFSLTQRSGEASQSAGIFVYDLAAKKLYQAFGSGFQLEDAAADGTALLVSAGSELFITTIDGKKDLVTDKLANNPRQSRAFWLPNQTQILVLTQEDENQPVELWLVDPAIKEWQALASGEITGLIKPTQNDTFYWYQGQCHEENGCEENSIWTIQNDQPQPFAELSQASFSPFAQTYAWVETTEENLVILYTRTTDQTYQDYVYLPGNRLMDLAWDPNANRLALLTVTRSDYSGKSSDARIFVVDTGSMSHLEYYAFPGLNASLHWRPDSSELLLTSTLALDEGYQIHFRQMDLVSGLFENLDEALQITSTDFITLSKSFWIFPSSTQE